MDEALAPLSAALVRMSTAGIFLSGAVAYLCFHIITVFLTVAFTSLAVEKFEICFRFCIRKYPTLASYDHPKNQAVVILAPKDVVEDGKGEETDIFSSYFKVDFPNFLLVPSGPLPVGNGNGHAPFPEKRLQLFHLQTIQTIPGLPAIQPASLATKIHSKKLIKLVLS